MQNFHVYPVPEDPSTGERNARFHRCKDLLVFGNKSSVSSFWIYLVGSIELNPSMASIQPHNTINHRDLPRAATTGASVLWIESNGRLWILESWESVMEFRIFGLQILPALPVHISSLLGISWSLGTASPSGLAPASVPCFQGFDQQKCPKTHMLQGSKQPSRQTAL